MDLGTPHVFVAPAHPSLDGAVGRFCDELRVETRYFGRRAAAAPKPAASLIRRLESPVPGIALAALVDGQLIGLARIDEHAVGGPELLVAVAGPWRKQGVALALVTEIVARAHRAGMSRIVLRTCYRASELRQLGDALGFQVVDLGQGRLDLVRWLAPTTRPA
jgi:GNAT superfamily N-acetyltransferase